MNLEEENNRIDAYLGKRLTPQEIISFELHMEENVRFRESVLLQKQLQEALNDEDWSFAEQVDADAIKSYEAEFRRQETKDLAVTLKSVNAQYQKTTSKRNINFRPWLLSLSAAIIAVLLAVKVLLPSEYAPEDLYVKYFDTQELPSLVVRGDNESQLVKAQHHFEEKEYVEALSIFEQQLDHNPRQKSTLFVYKGISEMELNQFAKAAQTFELLSTSNLLDASKGFWYAALLQLKQGNVSEAKKELERILESRENYKFKEAKTLLGQL